MADRHLPVRPNLDQLRHQAKDLLRNAHRGEPRALDALREHGLIRATPSDARLADAQYVLARSYGIANWPRLVLACKLVDAIWRDDDATVRDLVLRHPRLLREDARGVKGNWGRPMAYAANLGRDRIIDVLRDLGADDVQFAFERACLQGRIETARRLYTMGARPVAGLVMGPCETQSATGLALLLELVARHGITLPDTPTMAVHRGRIDLLEACVSRDSGLLNRTFSHAEIYPPDLGCHADETLALHGTPLAGTTLLHLCVDNDELEMARWLLEHGADPNARAAIDADGFGGHTALFGCVVSQPSRSRRRTDDALARLLLDRGADPGARASLRKRLRFVDDESMHEYRAVTPLAWGQRFHDQTWVNPAVVTLLAALG
jgi:hypothetical protein